MSKTRASCFITGSKYLETDESTRPQASCFHLLLDVWNPWWSSRPRFWHITWKTIFSSSLQEDGQAPVHSSIYETVVISLHIYKLYGFAHEMATSSGNSKEMRHSNIPPVFISQCASNVIFGLIVDSQYLPLTTCFSLALISLQDTAAISRVDPSGTGI